MAKNRLFIYDPDSNTAVCIAKGNAERWGKITDNGSSEFWFENMVKESPGCIGEMCSGNTKLQLKTEKALPLLCNVINILPKEPDNRPVESIQSVKEELEHVRELNRENVGRVEALNEMVKERDRIIDQNTIKNLSNPSGGDLGALKEENKRLQAQVSKLIDILHTKEKGYFD